MTTQRNAMPFAVLRGARDISKRAPIPVPEQIPTHLPLFWLITERGDTSDAHIVSGDTMITMYGRKSFLELGPYTTHATLMLNTIQAQGNACMVQRLVPPGAKTASLRLSLDLLPTTLPVYERGIDGKHTLDASGDKIPTGDTVTGFKVKWVVSEIPADNFGQGSIGLGSQVDGATTSSLIPWMDFIIPDHGEYGNRVGVRLMAPTVESSIPLDGYLAEDQLAYLFRIQFVEKDDDQSAPQIIENLFGEKFVDFTLKPGTMNRKTEQMLYLDQAVLPRYQKIDDPSYAPFFGPFKAIKAYDSNIAQVYAQVYAQESLYTSFPAGVDNQYLLNLFTGVTHTNLPYETVQVLGVADGGVALTATTTLYAQGGSDGDISLSAFDELVRQQAENFGEMEVKYDDLLRYPCSVFYDSGYSIDTKRALATFMGRRKNTVVVVACQDISGPVNTPSADSSVAIALRNAYRLYPESEFHGTPACRAMVVGQAGRLIGSQYTGYVPYTFELAQKFARYMGAGSGIWDSTARPDVYPNNESKLLKDINYVFRPAIGRAADWDNGLVWAESSGRKTTFVPAMQTVYDNDTSVLNSIMNAFILAHLEYIAVLVWRDLTGRTDLTPNEFLELSDQRILEYTRNKFDGRAEIEPKTHFTAIDDVLGWSWSTTIKVSMSTMRTVNYITIETDRRAFFNQQ